MPKPRELSDFEKLLFTTTLERKMINLAMLLTRSNKADSKDLIQDSYLKAIENQVQFNGNNIDAWVITILKNTFKDTYKKGTYKNTVVQRDFDDKKIEEITRVKRIQSYGDDVPEISTSDNSEMPLLERDSAKCLEGLSINEQEIIALKQSDSYDEIAKDLGIKAGTIRQIYSRAKEKFILCMGFLNE
jgi:RNA polymerase sigma factor (sigma-70 family)